MAMRCNIQLKYLARLSLSGRCFSQSVTLNICPAVTTPMPNPLPLSAVHSIHLIPRLIESTATQRYCRPRCSFSKQRAPHDDSHRESRNQQHTSFTRYTVLRLGGHGLTSVERTLVGEWARRVDGKCRNHQRMGLRTGVTASRSIHCMQKYYFVNFWSKNKLQFI